MTILVRPATWSDAPALTTILNAIIEKGGTTAHQHRFSETRFTDDYLTGPAAIACHVAEIDGRTVGFQVLGYWPGLPEGWSDIGTFLNEDARGTGAGNALFQVTSAVAKDLGHVAINATIRADNHLGLGYYRRLGFVEYAQDPDWALDAGRRVGRVSMRIDL